jgi:hypothetical protein
MELSWLAFFMGKRETARVGTVTAVTVEVREPRLSLPEPHPIEPDSIALIRDLFLLLDEWDRRRNDVT